MYDTLKLASPTITEQMAQVVEARGIWWTKLSLDPMDNTGTAIPARHVDSRSGEVRDGVLLKEVCNVPLLGSHDARVRVAVQREEWKQEIFRGKVVGLKPFACAPYLEVECSIHKLLLGHNVYGGPMEFRPAAYALVAFLEASLGIVLPGAGDWRVCRVDVAEVFVLGAEAVQEYIRGLNSAYFPRRGAPIRYGNESLMSAGRTTTVKLYHKGPEFRAHDKSRLRVAMGPAEVEALESVAFDRLRVEVEIKVEKLMRDNGGKKPLVDSITDTYLSGIYEREVARLIREAKSEMDIVRDHDEVRKRLNEQYSRREASILFGFYAELATLGQERVKTTMPVRTFYSRRKLLVDAGIAWHGSNIQIVERLSPVPVDFVPRLADKRRDMQGEAPEVAAILQFWRDRLAA